MQVEVASPLERNWEPFQRQKQFISLPFSIFEALYGGAAGGGKSETLLLLPLIYNFHDHPLFKGLILRRTFPELESEIILRSKEWYPHAGGIYNEGKKRWTFPRGAVIQFGHAEREEHVRKYDTAQYNYIGWDEATSFTAFQYTYLSMSRVRSRTTDLPAIVRAGTNPGNVGHAFFRSRFVDPWKLGGKLLVDKKTGLKRIFIPSKLHDNPHVLAANPGYAAQLESLPEAEKRAKLEGDWYTFEGQVFKEWRIEPLKDEPEFAQHVIDPFEIPIWWPKVVGIDWGYAANTWIGWSAISPEGRVYLYREYCEKEKKTVEWVSDFIDRTDPEERANVKAVRICHSANQKRGEWQNQLQVLSQAMRKWEFPCTPGLAEQNRVGGKQLVHEYLRWQPKPDIRTHVAEEFNQERADQIFRLQGHNAYLQYLKLFDEPEPETNLPKLQVFSTCENITDVIPSCVYDETRVEDVKEFTGDDSYDGLRIMLGGIRDHLIGNAKARAQELQEAEIINELANSENQTAYYRRMEHFETKQRKNTTLRRRRFSHRRRVRRM